MSGRSAERGARPGSSPAAARARGRYAFIRAESADRRTRLIQIRFTRLSDEDVTAGYSLQVYSVGYAR
jgi:hypothetical protein